MSVTYETAVMLFRQGEYAQLVSASGANYRALPPQHRVLVAYALANVDAFDAAIETAELDRHPPTPPVIRSRAEVAMGLAQWRKGNISAAAPHYQTAVRLANESGDAEQIATAHLNALRLTIDSGSFDAAFAALPEARRVVIRAAVPQLSAWLHNCVGALEAQIGNLDEALRHFDIAELLLRLAPHLEVSSNLHLCRALVSVVKCDFRQADRYFRGAWEAARKTESATRLLEVEVNKGYAEMMTGRFAEAERTMTRVARQSPRRRAVAWGAVDSIARMHLAVGRFEECEAVLDRLEVEHEGSISTYHIERHVLTRARLALRRGRPRDALSCLESVEAQGHTRRDLATSAALHVLAAEAWASVGDMPAATRYLLTAARSGMTGLREVQGFYYAGAAAILQDDPSGISEQLRTRAYRVWSDQGVVLVPRELGLSLAPAADAHAEPLPVPSPVSLVHVVDGLAATLDLAHRPPLLGQELLQCVQRAGCASDARIVTLRSDVPEPASTDTHVALPLGSYDEHSHTFVCRMPDHPRDALVLTGILTIAQAALALETARHADRRRAAIWPAGHEERETDALFIADETRTLLAAAGRIAVTTVPVLITGETGTGKEVLARTIHARSNRAQATFLPFSCSSVPKDMLDAQLFGYRKGAFTGATDHFPGVIRSAAGGTLFLDEVGEIPLDVQPKLLRFLESGEVHPLGESKPVAVDVRILAATNADLEALIAAGRFREDLFYRLNIVRLSVPPLRERRVEITALAEHYLREYALEYLKGDLRLAEETLEYLVLYRWPGNIRQLANEMRRLAAFAEVGAVLMPEHLSPDIVASRRTIPASERALDPTELVVRLDQPLDAAIEHVERAAIEYALRQCNGRMDDTASMLGLSRKGLYLKRQRLGLDPPGGDPEATGVA